MRRIALALLLALAAAPPAGAADLFAPIAEVALSPRCLNCHQPDRPLQSDDGHLHRLNVWRGPDNLGNVGMRCTACHGESNNGMSSVPGAPRWSLAPASMDWSGLDAAALCHMLTDRGRNGDRDGAALLEHMTEDPLVQWAWAPGTRADGGRRAPPAMPRATFHRVVHDWVAAGMPCPKG